MNNFYIKCINAIVKTHIFRSNDKIHTYFNKWKRWKGKIGIKETYTIHL